MGIERERKLLAAAAAAAAAIAHVIPGII
jgi:hypothetical protein